MGWKTDNCRANSPNPNTPLFLVSKRLNTWNKIKICQKIYPCTIRSTDDHTKYIKKGESRCMNKELAMSSKDKKRKWNAVKKKSIFIYWKWLWVIYLFIYLRLNGSTQKTMFHTILQLTKLEHGESTLWCTWQRFLSVVHCYIIETLDCIYKTWNIALKISNIL